MKMMYKGLGGMTATDTKQQSGGIQYTSDFKARTQYRRRRMPRYKRRNWARFVKKVRAANLKLIGTNSIVRNNTVTTEVGSANQGIATFSLYSKNGVDTGGGVQAWVDTATDDLAKMMLADNRINGAGTHKMLFSSAVLDATIRNQGDGQIELDIYDIVYGEDTRYSNFSSLISAAETNTNTVPGGVGTSLGIITRGATLFDFPNLIKLAKMKILKKTKVFLPAGDATNYQVRNPKNKVFNDIDFLQDNTGFIQPYMTRTIVVIYKAVTGSAATAKLSLGITRKYSYKVMEDNEDYDAVV